MGTYEGIIGSKALPLHKVELDPRLIPNRLHALVYSCAILALLYHHILRLLHPTTFYTFIIYVFMLAADVLLAFMWATNQGYRWCPIRRKEFPENLFTVAEESDLPRLDVFICTADPYKEPPMNVVNTALSIMAYDYPAEKISVYVSDDGGSELTLFAFMEAAKFARHWLPFCRENKILDRCPEVYFKSNGHDCSSEIKIHTVHRFNIKALGCISNGTSQKLLGRGTRSRTGSAASIIDLAQTPLENNRQAMYESMKDKVDSVMERGRIATDLLATEEERRVFEQWTSDFTKQDHHTVIQVLLQSDQDRDHVGYKLSSLVYVSREKRKTSSHHFKSGALNTLLRVSGVMSNSPVILTLDCDMYSNDPQAARRALCYLVDPSKEASKIAYVQYPQRYEGINESDIYACEHKRLFQINPLGMDGLEGPNFVGTGCFFRRQALYGPPSSDPNGGSCDMISKDPIHVLEAAHRVARCTYEDDTKWGHQVGFRYGSLVEDFFTGYRLTCQGWRSVFCNPERPAFLGDVPINLEDALSQNKRWCVGLLEVVVSKYNPFTFGGRFLSAPLALCYAHISHWAVWSIPITIYAQLPSLALLSQIQLFPKVGDPWFYLCVYLFLGAYTQDLLDFIIDKGTIKRWWSDQRMWMMRGVSSYLFALVQFSLQLIGIHGVGFNVTSKVVDEDQNKHYEQGIFEFGVPSPFFVTIGTFASINLISFIVGLAVSIHRGSFDKMFLQLFIAVFVVVNGWPVYEAMAVRKDKGKMPRKVTAMSFLFACTICLLSVMLLRA